MADDDITEQILDEASAITDDAGERFPIVLLVDTSPSMGDNPDGSPGDLTLINQSLPKLFDQFRPNHAMSEFHDRNIDLTLITYSDTDPPLIQMPWTSRENLPQTIPKFGVTGGATHTYAAFNYALTLLANKLREYRDQDIDWGMPNVIHFTDGGPTDMSEGDPQWANLQARLSEINTASNPTRAVAHVVHLIPPNGRNGGGYEAMTRLSGNMTAFDIQQGADAVDKIVRVIKRMTKAVTAPLGKRPSISQAANAYAKAAPSDITQRPVSYPASQRRQT